MSQRVRSFCGVSAPRRGPVAAFEPLEARLVLSGPMFPTLQAPHVGTNPYSLVVADFDGDGNMDVVTANNRDDTISVLLGNGDGSFASRQDYAAGDGPMWVGAARFNGDAHLDLLVSNYNSKTLTLFLGNGDGTFQDGQHLAVGDNPLRGAFGDVNSDGNFDLSLTFGYTIAVFLGNGDGTTQPPVIYDTYEYANSICLADLNGDGWLDMTLVHSGDYVGVMLNDGTGAFGASTLYETGDWPSDVAVADFNNDGFPDLVTGNHSGYSISVLLGNGDGTFQDQAEYPLEMDGDDIAYINKVLAADLDVDGNVDLVVLGEGWPNNSAVLMGKGDGTFADR